MMPSVGLLFGLCWPRFMGVKLPFSLLKLCVFSFRKTLVDLQSGSNFLASEKIVQRPVVLIVAGRGGHVERFLNIEPLPAVYVPVFHDGSPYGIGRQEVEDGDDLLGGILRPLCLSLYRSR